MARKNELVVLPKNLTELNERIAHIGTLTTLIDSKKVAAAEAIDRIRTTLGSELAPIAETLEKEIRAVELYAQTHRDTLLPKDVKSVSFPAGRIGWRFTPWKVTFLRGGAEKVLAFLMARRSKRFLRITTEIDKEALLRHRPKIDGVRYKQTEEFFVEPKADTLKVEAMGEVIVVST